MIAPRRTTEPAEHGFEQLSRLTREQVVDRIVTINPTATSEFLTRFATPELRCYLQRLKLVGRRSARGSAWTRQTTSPAIVTRSARS